MGGITLLSHSDVTSFGLTVEENLQKTAMKTFCKNFAPIQPTKALHNITVIENTQMFYQAPEFCDDQSEDLKNVLTKGDGTGLDQWTMWDKTERIMKGLVPVGQYKFLYMRLTGTDKNGL